MNANLSTLAIDDRIASGRLLEQQVLDTIRKKGVRIDPPSSHEDITDKIDGWIVEKNGNRHSVQVKVRETGTDIIVEIFKNLRLKTPGRDMVGGAEYYILDTSDATYIFLHRPIKELAKFLVHKLESEFATKSRWEGDGWQLKKTIDNSSGETKLMGYFSPNRFTKIIHWRKS